MERATIRLVHHHQFYELFGVVDILYSRPRL